MKKPCKLCKTMKIREKIIYENAFFVSILDIHPVSPGHALVIPKRHVVSLLELNKEEWESLFPAIKEVISFIENTVLRKEYEKLKRIVEKKEPEEPTSWIEEIMESPNLGRKPDGYNIGNNEGRAAGRTIDHLHIQIIPRYEGDVGDPTGGIRNVIKEKGNYKK